MRKKLAIGVVLFVTALMLATIAVWWTMPAEPPLRMGMSHEESDRILREHGLQETIGDQYQAHYYKPKGGSAKGVQAAFVFYEDGRVQKWEFHPTFRERQQWLDEMLKDVGW